MLDNLRSENGALVFSGSPATWNEFVSRAFESVILHERSIELVTGEVFTVEFAGADGTVYAYDMDALIRYEQAEAESAWRRR